MNEAYEWAHVTPKINGQKTSGTSLFAQYLERVETLSRPLPALINRMSSIYSFSEQVRRWDTWDWKDVYGGAPYPKQLNNLLYLIGRQDFVSRWSSNLDLNFSEGESLVLSIEEANIEKYIEKVGKTIIVKEIAGYTAGVVFAESYSSELGNVLAESNPDLDFIAIVNALSGTVSYRGVKDYVDLGKDVAPLYGGGGHPRAAGSQIDPLILKTMTDIAFIRIGG